MALCCLLLIACNNSARSSGDLEPGDAEVRDVLQESDTQLGDATAELDVLDEAPSEMDAREETSLPEECNEFGDPYCEFSEVCGDDEICEAGCCRPRAACNPYPRRDDYGCSRPGDTCVPDAGGAVPVVTCGESSGYCAQGFPEGAGEGEPCEEDGFFGGGCADFALCADFSGTGEGPECHPLCSPFTYDVDQCEKASCSGVQVIFGSSYGFCSPNAQPGEAFGRCTEEGEDCAEDGTVCLDINGNGPQCWPVCRMADGCDDCALFEGRTCDRSGLNPEVVPEYIGLCQ